MNIIELSQDEKERAIEDILSKGLSKPKSLWGYLCEIYCALGFRYIFLDTGLAIIMTVVATIGFIRLYPMSLEQYPYATLFALAPVFFLFVVLFAETIERVSGLYELKMTCKYTVQQITAFRVLCFSLMGAMFCTLTSLHFSRLPITYDFFRVFSLSLCALFLCAFLTIFIMRRFTRDWIYFIAMLLWTAIGFLPVRIFGHWWELFLSQVPITITVFVAVIACALFLMEIKNLMKIRKREVAYYVGC